LEECPAPPKENSVIQDGAKVLNVEEGTQARGG
jgi:hypothetical protein